MALLQELNRGGITIVVVTHEHDIAAFASRLLAFRDGKLRRSRHDAETRRADAGARRSLRAARLRKRDAVRADA